MTAPKITDEQATHKIAAWRAARVAAELVRNVLAQHDWAELIQDGKHASEVAWFLDPTLYRERNKLVREDLEVFEAARAFLATWGDRPLRPCFEPAPTPTPEIGTESTRAAILRPERSRHHDAGPEDYDRRIWTWRPYTSARPRVFRCGIAGAMVEELTIGVEAPIGGLPCSLELVNTLLGDCRIVAVPGIEVRIRFADEVPTCAVGFEVIA